eukprot:CAMPEP_0184679124 /NCGR_PEP_ID=MMETSP0312-20130426/1950_1 /TAXON_ID=31354 /ORGANISM="Compsopogon coeruleus, Strain SAG 36.94" /LENGTH=744 /DNA_ID=CAMNT_0027128373 /DNA_START=22 /DNA_END=2256 /DNA_ORIENTATION=+
MVVAHAGVAIMVGLFFAHAFVIGRHFAQKEFGQGATSSLVQAGQDWRLWAVTNGSEEMGDGGWGGIVNDRNASRPSSSRWLAGENRQGPEASTVLTGQNPGLIHSETGGSGESLGSVAQSQISGALISASPKLQETSVRSIEAAGYQASQEHAYSGAGSENPQQGVGTLNLSPLGGQAPLLTQFAQHKEATRSVFPSLPSISTQNFQQLSSQVPVFTPEAPAVPASKDSAVPASKDSAVQAPSTLGLQGSNAAGLLSTAGAEIGFVGQSQPSQVSVVVEPQLVPISSQQVEAPTSSPHNKPFNGYLPQETAAEAIDSTRMQQASPSQPAAGLAFPLLEVWKLNQAGRLICRVHNTIRNCAGKFILPTYMQVYHSVLEQCKFPMVYEDIPQHSQVFDGDLFGTHELRYHMPHFLTDFIPVLKIFGTVFRSETEEIAEYYCLGVGGAPCDPALTSWATYKPLIFHHERVKSMPNDTWVRSLVGLLPQNPIQAFLSDFGQSKESCTQRILLRSVLSTSSSYNAPEETISKDHVIFRHNNIDRSANTGCHLKVVILNRQQGNGRSIINTGQVRDVIIQEGVARALQVDVQEVDFEGLSFEKQVQTMLSGDIVIAAHGAALTNIIFMKEHSSIVEVMPFGWDAKLFSKKAETFRVFWKEVRSYPDRVSFLNCLHSYLQKKPLDMHILQGITSVFDWASSEGSASAEERLYELDQQSGVAEVRVCLRAQDLTVNPVTVGAQAFADVRRCN